MLNTRYALAADLSDGKDVLEIACGAGMGLGLIAKRARRVVAGDFSAPLLDRARQNYGGRVAFARLDAHSLPFENGSFDLVLCFEAIYYFRDPRTFVLECKRILRPAGALVICAANPSCPGFCPSPYSHRYFRAEELRLLLAESNFAAVIHGAFPFSARTLQDLAVAAIRTTAARFRLFPRSMKGKEFLKRMFYGALIQIQEEVGAGSVCPEMLRPISPFEEESNYKVLYAIARR